MPYLKMSSLSLVAPGKSFAKIPFGDYYTKVAIKNYRQYTWIREGEYEVIGAFFAYKEAANQSIQSPLFSGHRYFNAPTEEKATIAITLDKSNMTLKLENLDTKASVTIDLSTDDYCVYQLGYNTVNNVKYLQLYTYYMKNYRFEDASRPYRCTNFAIDGSWIRGEADPIEAYETWIQASENFIIDGANLSNAGTLTFDYHHTANLTDRTWGEICYSGLGTGSNRRLNINNLENVNEKDETIPDDSNNDDYDGGIGDQDYDSDEQDFPDDPDISVVDSGFVTLYNPTLSQVQSMAAYLWSNLFDLDTLKKLFDDPMDIIIGLNIIPANVPDGGTRVVTVGNIQLSGVSMNVADSQWVNVDCGIVHCPTTENYYLDYAPYTKVQIWLPYIGMRDLACDDVMGKDIQLRYKIDIFTGACHAYIRVNGNILYSFTGECGMSIPFSGKNYNEVIGNLIRGVASATAAIMTSGASAVPEAALTAGAIEQTTTSAANTVINSKPNIQRSGNASSTAGLMGVQYPYLIITRPIPCFPVDQPSYMGIPSFKVKNITSGAGFERFQNIILKTSATEAEQKEIISLLESGVFA